VQIHVLGFGAAGRRIGVEGCREGAVFVVVSSGAATWILGTLVVIDLWIDVLVLAVLVVFVVVLHLGAWTL